MAEDLLHEYKMKYTMLLQKIAKERRPQYSAQIVKQIIGKENAAKYPSWVLQMADEWLIDSEVIAELERLDAVPKTREELLTMVLSFIGDSNVETKDRIAATRLYFEGAGYIAKGGGKEDATQNVSLDKITQLFNAAKPKG